MPHDSDARRERSVPITLPLQDAMIRDLARQMNRTAHLRPLAAVLAAVGVLCLITAVLSSDWIGVALGILVIALCALLLQAMRWIARRWVRLAYPVDLLATGRVTDTTLVSSTALSLQHTKFVAFSDVNVTKDSVLLSMRGTGGGVGAMPRALLGDDDIARLQSGVRRADHEFRASRHGV